MPELEPGSHLQATFCIKEPEEVAHSRLPSDGADPRAAGRGPGCPGSSRPPAQCPRELARGAEDICECLLL